MRIRGIVMLSLFISSCGGTPPQMERPISVWNGAPEVGGICRINAALLSQKLKLKIPQNALEKIIAEGVDCIPATDERFKEYGCMSFDDIGVLRRWEESLINQCEKWKK